MFELFSTREVVSGIYFSLIIMWVLLNRKTRKSAIQLVRTACTRKLVIPFLGMIIYAGVLVYGFSLIPVWKWEYLKDVVTWVLFAGIPLCFNAVSQKDEEHYFRNIVTDNFKYTALSEFFLGIFTFPFFAELILQPILFFLFMMQSFLEGNEKDRKAKNMIDGVITIVGILILVFSIRQAVDTYRQLGAIDILVSFLIPIILSAVYVPVAYFFAIYAKYEVLFIRMGFKLPQNKKVALKRRLKVIYSCKLSYRKICRFEKEYVNRIYGRMQDNEFEALILESLKNI